jgi:hypothetical protein
MEELIGAVLRTFAGLLNVQSMFTTKTESEGTIDILPSLKEGDSYCIQLKIS